ncbi:MAG TPA: phosphatase PAP2 family protein [Chloroflexia bacterium]|nr:phosphatase PAP2 family protein [Chloroflexia bacterium]
MSVANKREQPNRALEFIKVVLQSLGWYGVAGIVIAVGLAWGFAGLSEGIAEKQLGTVDHNIQYAVHSWDSPFLGHVFEFFTFLGEPLTMMLFSAIVIGLFLITRQFSLAIVSLLVTGGGAALDELFKQIFHRARPDLWQIEINGVRRPLSYSYPSGHATFSMCFFGLLACLAIIHYHSVIGKWLVALLMAIIILMIGLSRIYFGVHYPSDVAGGYILGGFWLASIMVGYNRYKYFFKRKEATVAANHSPQAE